MLFFSSLERDVTSSLSRSVTLLLVLLGAVFKQTANGTEYCLEEQLEAQCSPDEIVLVENARYGRMRLNRCVRTDYGYIGCGTDVTDVLAGKCSGRRRCRIVNLEALFAASRTCPTDLKSYLEATHSCSKVVIPSASTQSRARCSPARVHQHQTLPPPLSDANLPEASGPSGLLASIVTLELGVGSASCPWLVVALPGQRINITLMDFTDYDTLLTADRATATARPESAPPAHRGGATRDRRSEQGASRDDCRDYAVVTEGTSAKKLVTCPTDKPRTRVVYTSNSHRLKVSFMLPGEGRGGSSGSVSAGVVPGAGSVPLETDIELVNFALKYDVFGCIHPPTLNNAHIVVMSDDTIKIQCNETAESWTLRCVAGEVWTGTIGNCTETEMLHSATDFDNYLPYGLSLLVVIVVALFICLITLATGLAYMHRHRDDRPRSILTKHRHLTSSSGSTYALAPVHCTDLSTCGRMVAMTTTTTPTTPSSPGKSCTLPPRLASSACGSSPASSPRTCRLVSYSPATMRNQRFLVGGTLDCLQHIVQPPPPPFDVELDATFRHHPHQLQQQTSLITPHHCCGTVSAPPHRLVWPAAGDSREGRRTCTCNATSCTTAFVDVPDNTGGVPPALPPTANTTPVRVRRFQVAAGNNSGAGGANPSQHTQPFSTFKPPPVLHESFPVDDCGGSDDDTPGFVGQQRPIQLRPERSDFQLQQPGSSVCRPPPPPPPAASSIAPCLSLHVQFKHGTPTVPSTSSSIGPHQHVSV